MIPSVFLEALDLIGTAAFAISGAGIGLNKRFDLLRATVLAVAAGITGGLTRDVLIGALPPPAISNWLYLGATLTAVVVTFLWSRGSTANSRWWCSSMPSVSRRSLCRAR